LQLGGWLISVFSSLVHAATILEVFASLVHAATILEVFVFIVIVLPGA
jgi:hypothetical protein